MLLIHELTKSFGQQHVLRGLDLSVSAGEITAVVGVNGAGKSTLASMVAGLQKPDSGEINMAGVDAVRNPHLARRRLGLAAQDIGLYPTLTGRDNLNFFGRLAGVRSCILRQRINELSQSLELAEFLDRRVATLSGGQRRRLHAAIAMLHRPALLWLDEPTVGADIRSRQQILDAVRRFAEDGGAVVYATHYFPEIENLGASVAILHRGRIIARGTCESIIGRYVLPSVALVFDGDIPDNLATFRTAADETETSRAVIPVRQLGPDLARIIGRLGKEASRLRSVELHQPSLESAFLNMTDENPIPEAEKALDAVAS
jgi:ABC-2 type transport system ATP-binding protein